MSDTPRMDAVRDYTCPEIMYREGCRIERELAEAREFIQRCATETDGLRWRYHKIGEMFCELIAEEAKKLLKRNAASEAGEVEHE